MKNHREILHSSLLLCLILLASHLSADEPSVKPHRLRLLGRTLIEAEDYSAINEKYPSIEPSPGCSGQEHLGYFWKNTWFDVEVEVTSLCKFDVSLRAASEKSTKIEMSTIGQTGADKLPRTIDAPKTGGAGQDPWSTFVTTKQVSVTLEPGIHRLRFKNVTAEPANIDYITFSPSEIAIIRPKPSDGPTINPLKGFNSSWWRSDEDYASVGFQYIEWGKLEPTDDEFDWDYVEEVLNRDGSRGRHFILQFVVDWNSHQLVDDNYLGPKWLLEKVGEKRGAEREDDPDSRMLRATNYNDPEFVAEATEAVEALIERYGDDPRAFVLQVGVLGFWAEWHTYPRADWSPTDDTKSKILHAYTSNLGQNGLTQIRNPKEPIAEPRRGLGYTNGSATLTDRGKEFGRAIAEGELWKNGPIGGEWPANVDSKHWNDFFKTDAGPEFLNAAHYSTMCPPEPKQIAENIPGWTPQDNRFMTMHRQLGYNFRVTEVRHFAAIDSSRRTIEVDIANVGIAPFYKDWNVQFGLFDTETRSLLEPINVEADLRTLQPERSQTLTATTKPLDTSKQYTLGIRILQPSADKEKEAWKLNARNVYVVLANMLEVVEGEWDKNHALRGGWNILGELEYRATVPQLAKEGFAPFQGSFRPADQP